MRIMSLDVGSQTIGVAVSDPFGWTAPVSYTHLNIAHGFELMEEAAEHSDLVVMPELWTIGYNFHDLDKKAIQEKDSLLQKLRNLARTFGVTLIPGTLPVMKRGKIYNTAYVIGPDGEIQGSYSKRHLFHEYLESKLMEPGRGMLCTHIPVSYTHLKSLYYRNTSRLNSLKKRSGRLCRKL